MLSPQQAVCIRQGQTVEIGEISPDVQEAAAVDADDALVAILTPRTPGHWRPTRTFPLPLP